MQNSRPNRFAVVKPDVRKKTAVHKVSSLVGALEWPLSTYPDWTGMLGGTEVLVSGPCFPPGSGILCKFDDVIVDGFMVS